MTALTWPDAAVIAALMLAVTFVKNVFDGAYRAWRDGKTDGERAALSRDDQLKADVHRTAEVQLAVVRDIRQAREDARADVYREYEAQMASFAKRLEDAERRVDGAEARVDECEIKHRACEDRCAALTGRIDELETGRIENMSHIAELERAVQQAGVTLTAVTPLEPTSQKEHV